MASSSSSLGPIGNHGVQVQDVSQEMYAANGRFNPAVLELLQGAIASAACSQGKEIVALLGYTGCGKSTIVNHLLGRTIVYNRTSKRFEVAAGETEIAKIGHKYLDSETLFPSAYEADGVPYTLLDCGGLLDTRGVNTDIAVASSIKLALENSKSVRLLLCFESNAILTNKCQDFIKFLNAILRSLVKNYAEHDDSIHLLFTKPHFISDDKRYDKEDAINDLHLIESFAPEGGALKNLIQFLLRDEGKYISVHNPRSPESRISTLEAIQQLNGIEKTRTAFKTFYAAQSGLVIMEALTRIAVLGLDLYQRYFQLLESCKRENTALMFLIQRIQGITEQIGRLGAGENNPDLIQDVGNRIRQQHLDMVAQQNASIEDNERAKRETQERINEVLQKIDAWNIAGEIPDLYWEDEINEKGVRYIPRTVRVETKSRTWYGKVKTHAHFYTVQDPIAIVTPKDFQYRGPPLESVVKTPTESPCWSLEKLEADNKTYSIHYDSQQGVDAVANVKVFVKRKNKPDEVDMRASLENDQMREIVEFARLEEAIRGHAILRTIAQRNADSKAQDLDRLIEQKAALEEFCAQKTNFEATLAALEQQKQAVKIEIVQNRPEFDFLNDFLRLSGDYEMTNREVIIKFVALNALYSQENDRA